jgi:hypothetical protein
LAVLRLMTSSNLVGSWIGKVGGLGTLDNLVHIACATLEEINKVRAVAHQPADLSGIAVPEDRWQSLRL